MNFYFRINCSEKVGLGHLSRSLKLANEFKKRGNSCFFYVDRIKDLKEININFPVFQIDENYIYKNENDDAKKFIKKIKDKKGYIVLDDYRSQNSWKKIIKKSRIKLINISDDSKFDNLCDYTINYKLNSNKIKKPTQKKVKYLLGPKYTLLEKNKKNLYKHKYKKFNIVLYQGGAGNLNIFEGISKQIKKIFLKNNILNFDIKIILGPLIKEKKKFIKKYKNEKNITVIYNEINLQNIYKNCQLFVGSSGTSVYETSSANLPTILFKYADNQDDSIYDLELIGHFIHLEKKEIFKFNKIAELIFLIHKNYSRIKKMTKSKKIKIDNTGPKRIYDTIFRKKKIINYKFNNIKEKVNYKFSEAKDIDINKIIDLRNEKHNRLASINTSKINRLDHYIWWFKSGTKIFLSKQNNVIDMLLWLKVIKVGSKKYTLAGWSSKKNLLFIKILNGIKKLNLLLKKMPPLLSIVKRNNQTSLAIDNYFQYEEILKVNKPLKNFLKKNSINLKSVRLASNRIR